jgi:hypothetical protein
MMDGNPAHRPAAAARGQRQGGGELGLRAHHAAAAQRACAGARRGHARRLFRLQARALKPFPARPVTPCPTPTASTSNCKVSSKRARRTGATVPSSTRCWWTALRPAPTWPPSATSTPRPRRCTLGRNTRQGPLPARAQAVEPRDRLLGRRPGQHGQPAGLCAGPGRRCAVPQPHLPGLHQPQVRRAGLPAGLARIRHPRDVKALADDLHGRGMKLVLDGVFNHMGRNAPLFQQEA